MLGRRRLHRRSALNASPIRGAGFDLRDVDVFRFDDVQLAELVQICRRLDRFPRQFSVRPGLRLNLDLTLRRRHDAALPLLRSVAAVSRRNVALAFSAHLPLDLIQQVGRLAHRLAAVGNIAERHFRRVLRVPANSEVSDDSPEGKSVRVQLRRLERVPGEQPLVVGLVAVWSKVQNVRRNVRRPSRVAVEDRELVPARLLIRRPRIRLCLRVDRPRQPLSACQLADDLALRVENRPVAHDDPLLTSFHRRHAWLSVRTRDGHVAVRLRRIIDGPVFEHHLAVRADALHVVEPRALRNRLAVHLQRPSGLGDARHLRRVFTPGVLHVEADGLRHAASGIGDSRRQLRRLQSERHQRAVQKRAHRAVDALRVCRRPHADNLIRIISCLPVLISALILDTGDAASQLIRSLDDDAHVKTASHRLAERNRQRLAERLLHLLRRALERVGVHQLAERAHAQRIGDPVHDGNRRPCGARLLNRRILERAFDGLSPERHRDRRLAKPAKRTESEPHVAVSLACTHSRPGEIPSEISALGDRLAEHIVDHPVARLLLRVFKRTVRAGLPACQLVGQIVCTSQLRNRSERTALDASHIDGHFRQSETKSLCD